jgi:hypothetical protein
MNRVRLRSAALVSLASMALVGAVAAPAQALNVPEGVACVETEHVDSARGIGDEHRGEDHRDVSAAEQRAIEKRTQQILAAKGRPGSGGGGSGTFESADIPVYVHVMRDSEGNGDVTDEQIADQIDVLNRTYGGDESSLAAETGFTFSLAGTYRYNNDQWHQDRQSSTYRKQTRKGGAGALNMWLVNFDYLGIATFPWDYKRQGAIDGIRVHYASLPGGEIANYNLGETATHEAGHWLGLYHTFQGGCTSTNDEVADTPAQGGPTNGCPEGADTCSLPGSDPIHNYMDYSYDSCYTEFTDGQATRMGDMWTAYRG